MVYPIINVVTARDLILILASRFTLEEITTDYVLLQYDDKFRILDRYLLFRHYKELLATHYFSLIDLAIITSLFAYVTT